MNMKQMTVDLHNVLLYIFPKLPDILANQQSIINISLLAYSSHNIYILQSKVVSYPEQIKKIPYHYIDVSGPRQDFIVRSRYQHNSRRLHLTYSIGFEIITLASKAYCLDDNFGRRSADIVQLICVFVLLVQYVDFYLLSDTDLLYNRLHYCFYTKYNLFRFFDNDFSLQMLIQNHDSRVFSLADIRLNHTSDVRGRTVTKVAK